MFTTFKRIVVSGLKTFWRNSLLSTSSILTVTITLVIAVTVYLTLVLTDASLKRIESKVDVNIYFVSDAQIEKVIDFKKELEKIPEIDKEKTKLLTKKETLEDFQKNNPNNSLVNEVIEVLNENPLGPVLNIKAKEIQGYKTIVKFLESDEIQAKYLPIIEATNYNDNAFTINRISQWIKYIKVIGVTLAGIMVFISLIIIHNTIRLIIYSYREEIHVMRLIGASNFFTRGPFLIEAMLYGVIAGILSVFISWSLIFYSKDLLGQIFILDLNRFFSDHIIEISGSLILGGIVISFISTFFAVARYLSVAEKNG